MNKLMAIEISKGEHGTMVHFGRIGDKCYHWSSYKVNTNNRAGIVERIARNMQNKPSSIDIGKGYISITWKV